MCEIPLIEVQLTGWKMSKVKINAIHVGFFNLSPLGDALAPNVFLKTAINVRGVINSTPNGWETSESATYKDFGIDLIAELSSDVTERLGAQAEVEITMAVYYRFEGGEKTVMATMTLPEPITLTATYDQVSLDTYGWMVEAGNALEDMLQTEGFIFNGGNGDDFFAPHSTILPSYADNILRGRGGDDHLRGGLGDDNIKGGTGDDVLIDPDGTNFLSGQSGDDILRLGDGSDNSVAKGGQGDDQLFSGAGSDTLRGGTGDDILDGGNGGDNLYGGRGNDILQGGAGSDFLKGHQGADQFIFNTEDQGHDRIADFTDNLDLMVLSGLASFDDLTVTQNGNDTLISWAGDSDITLTNFDSTLLGADDFMFI